MNVRLKCNCCDRTAEGTIGELHAKGWRHVTRHKGTRDKTITECPEHNGILTGREP